MSAQAAAVVAAINAQFEVNRAFELDDVPSPRPQEYIEVSVSRRFGGERRMSTEVGPTFYRAVVRGVSHSKSKNVDKALQKARAALEFQRISVGTRTSTPIQFETDEPTDPDDGWFSGVMTFTYTIRD